MALCVMHAQAWTGPDPTRGCHSTFAAQQEVLAPPCTWPARLNC